MSSFIKLMRDSELLSSMLNSGKHNEFILLTVIAMRAKRAPDPIKNLGVGDAFLGDFASYGLTEQKYRTAKANLEKWGVITLRATSRGTVATLCNTSIYDINIDIPNGQDNGQLTDKQRTANGQLTTNKKLKNYKNVKNKGLTPLPSDFEITDSMAQWFNKKNFTIPMHETTEKWKDSMLAKGNKYINWVSAWHNGMRLAQEWHDEKNKTVVPFNQQNKPRKEFPKVN